MGPMMIALGVVVVLLLIAVILWKLFKFGIKILIAIVAILILAELLFGTDILHIGNIIVPSVSSLLPI